MRIQLSSSTVVDDVISTLNSNADFDSIHIIFDHSFAEQGERELLKFINAFSNWPNLAHVAFSSEGHTYYTLPVIAVSTMLKTAMGIKGLTLNLIQITGVETDFAALAESFQHHMSIQQLHTTCWLSEHTRSSTNLDPLVRAIATSRSLQSVYIKPAFVFSELSCAVTGSLCTAPSLQVLSIHNCGLSDENVEAMALVLEENQNLQELHLSCNLGERGSLALARCLSINTSLYVLSIHNTATVAATNSNDEVIVTATSSSDETSATATHRNDGHYAEIARALRTNSSLKQLALHGVTLSIPSQRAFVNALVEDNLTLQKLSLVDPEESLERMIEIFTFLNACGRCHLLNDTNTKRSHWVEALARATDNLDCLYYFLSKKPSLCDVAEVAGKRKSDAELTGAKRRIISFEKKST